MDEVRKFLERYREEVNREADRLLKQELPELSEELFGEFERTGNRLRYEAVYFGRRRFLMVLGLSAFLGKDGVLKKLEETILEVCAERCWALPAHVDRRNTGWELTVDLFAAETAQTLAELTAVLGERLCGGVRARIREEVFRRVLDPFLSSEVPYAWWEHCHLNWCAVCNGSIGSAAMYLMGDEPERQRECLERVTDSMKYFLSGFGKDGACMEGLSYFTYGMTYFAGFAAQLLEFSNGRTDLFDNPLVERIAEFQQKCYFAGGRSLSFSDGSSGERFRMGLTCYLAMRYPGVRLPKLSLAAGPFEDTCFRWMGAFRDLVWTKRYLSEGHCKENDGEQRGQITLPDAQWVICENGAQTGMAVKGGHNDEPHNHNDVGSFLYFCGEEIFLPDLGAGEYTKDYFNENRYQIFCNHSFSHNVPVVAGMGQQEGRERCCTRFETDGDGAIRMEIQNAYPDGAAKKVERRLCFDFAGGRLSVADRFEGVCGDGETLENLISYCEPQIEGECFVLKNGKRTCRIRTGGAGLRVIPVDHALHSGEHKTVYRMVWEVRLSDGCGDAAFEIEGL